MGVIRENLPVHPQAVEQQFEDRGMTVGARLGRIVAPGGDLTQYPDTARPPHEAITIIVSPSRR